MIYMKYKYLPVVSANELAKAINLQYGSEWDSCDLSAFLFGDGFINDVCVRYSFDEQEVYEGHSWQDEDHIYIENNIKTFLQDTFPGFDEIIVDVSW